MPATEELRAIWNSDECKAYALAAHAVMACIIGETGVSDEQFKVKFLPHEWHELVPQFERISLLEDPPAWNTAPSSTLRKLTTLQIVLLADYAAQMIKYGFQDIRPAFHLDSTQKAFDMALCYVDEFGSSKLTYLEMARQARELMKENLVYTRGVILYYWPAVEKVAQELLLKQTVTRKEIAELVGTGKTEGFRDPATHFLCRGCRKWLPNEEISAHIQADNAGLTMFGAVFALGRMISGYKAPGGYLCRTCLRRRTMRERIFWAAAILIVVLGFVLEYLSK